jgi:CheY-like chemotaxis protein
MGGLVLRSGSKGLKMLRVLYLDDEPMLLDVFVDLFSSDKVDVSTFTDAHLAIAFAHEHQIDLAFLDYRVPGMLGDEVARRLPENLPKVLVSGELEISTTFPFLRILKKPLDLSEIQKIINEHLAKKSK